MCHRPADLDLGRGKRNMELAGPLKVTFITGERRGEFVRVIEARADDAGVSAAATVAGNALFEDDDV